MGGMLSHQIPVLRHLDGSFYLRQERDGLLIGPYEGADSMVQMEEWARDKVTPGFGKELYPGDLERLSSHLEPSLALLMQRSRVLSMAQFPIHLIFSLWLVPPYFQTCG